MKSRQTAALLSFFLGWLGVHRYYLGQPGIGIFYFFTNFIYFGLGFFFGIIDALAFMFMSDEEFDYRYNRKHKGTRRRYQSKRRTTSRRRTSNVTSRAKRKQEVEMQRKRKVNISKKNPFKLSGKRKLDEYELPEAIADFKRGLEISPQDAELHFYMACAQSLNEKAEDSFRHLSLAVSYGFKDYQRIRTEDSLAYIRVHPDFEIFEQAGYRLAQKEAKEKDEKQAPQVTDDKLLSQLNRLAELREKGLITEKEFDLERRKLMR
jgi:TM2 domain-containing membrane protein YozV